jgi:GntR family transcriptional regulator, histidine utilization repressor
MTVNRALRELADQGELVRYAGVGTFVGEQKPQSGLLRVASIADEIRARGHEYSCTVVLMARESAPLDVAAALGLRTGDGVFHSICVHHENGVAVQLEDRYVNPKVAPDFLSQDFTRVRPTEYLLEAVPLDEVEHVVDAVTASKKEAALLEVAPAEPCLVLTRRTWAGSDVVTFVRCLHPGSRYRLGSRFKTRGTQAFA